MNSQIHSWINKTLQESGNIENEQNTSTAEPAGKKTNISDDEEVETCD